MDGPVNGKWSSVEGSIVAPLGFRAGGVFCDIKRLGTGKGSAKGPKRDLALIVSDSPARVAGLFTTNQVCAAPVKVCLSRMSAGKAQAIVVNSGNANACTGRQGAIDAREMTLLTERALGIGKGMALVASTGRIGVPMPMDRVRQGIAEVIPVLGRTPDHAAHAAEAIMTSDSRQKHVGLALDLHGREVRIGGVAKGAGMIHPGMSADGSRPAALPAGLHATMLAFLTTDAAIDGRLLRKALTEAVALSFNRITVDGDMSTNDTVLVLANGLAGNPPIQNASSPEFRLFSEALAHACLELALQIVRDGEGVHRVVTVHVEGARSVAEADAAARAVGNSPLVKTSWHGGDPNWGRIIDALGYSPARVVESRVDIGYRAPGSPQVIWSLLGGQPTPVPYADLCAAVAPDSFELVIRLNVGRARATLYAADLTEAYVDYNKGDVNDPSTLGG
jgi:glutamate N-acetyltransferase/amino-acid N-acetyltransferase